MREVHDLELAGSVGQLPMIGGRTHHTRIGLSQEVFGRSGYWRHSFQYSMGDSYVDGATGQPSVEMAFPNGGIYRFIRQAADNTLWLPVLNRGYELRQNGSTYTVRDKRGFRYEFTKSGSTYRIQRILDPQGLATVFTHTGNLLTRVAEPAGRYFDIEWQDLDFTGEAANTLCTTKYSSPHPGGQWYEFPAGTQFANNAYRYLRASIATGVPADIAELEFYDENNQKIIGGTAFGTTPAADSNSGPIKAFDGDTTTAYRGLFRGERILGLDLGEGNARKVSKVRVFVAEGGGLQSTMFQGSNLAPRINKTISRVTDSDGRQVTYAYTVLPDNTLSFGWTALTSAVYGDGTQALYTYSQISATTRPLMTSAVDPRQAGDAVSIAYDYNLSGAHGLLLREKDGATGDIIAELGAQGGHVPLVTYPNGRVQRMVFDKPNANYSSERDSLNRTTTYTYSANGSGFLAGRTDPLGRTTSYTRTPLGNLLTTTHPDGTVETWTRGALDLPLTRTLSGPGIAPRTTTWTRDALNRVTRIDHPDGSYETFTYNAFNQVLTHRQRQGGTETFTYDARGLLTSRTDALGNQVTYTYDSKDRVATLTNARGFTTAYAYNDRGQVVQVTHPDSSTVAVVYDDFGNRIAQTNELGHTWSWTYDSFRRVLTATDPLNRITTTSYTASSGGGGGCGGCNTGGKPTQITLPSGLVTRMTYDSEWRLLTRTLAYGTAEAATTAFTYDNANNILTTTDPRGKVWTTTYDTRNRRLTEKDPLNFTTSYTYDGAGNVLTVTRPDGGVTVNTYDAMNRLLTTRNPKLETTTFAYDSGDNMTSL